jgi:hypothetical protein
LLTELDGMVAEELIGVRVGPISGYVSQKSEPGRNDRSTLQAVSSRQLKRPSQKFKSRSPDHAMDTILIADEVKNSL